MSVKRRENEIQHDQRETCSEVMSLFMITVLFMKNEQAVKMQHERGTS